MYQQLGAFIKASKNHSIFVNNVGDLKPAPLTSDAVFKLAWDPTPALTGDPLANALVFYADWGRRQVGLTDAAAQTAFVSVQV